MYFNLSGKWEFLYGSKIDVYHDSYLLTEITSLWYLLLTDNYIEILIIKKEKYITDDLIRSDQFGHRIPLVGFIL